MSDTETLAPTNGKDHGASRGTVSASATATSHAPVTAPFTAKTHDPDEFVGGIRLRHKNLERFRAWFTAQFPERQPSKDDWIDRIFAVGLREVEKEIPAVDPLSARFAAKFGEQ